MLIHRTPAVLATLVAIASLAGCAGSTPSTATAHSTQAPASPTAAMASNFHWRPSASPRGAWVMLLPGASGLTIFEDKDHYFRAASALNDLGYDAIVVDYKAAYKAASNPPRVSTGGKIAWVAEQAVAWARATGKIKDGQRGAIVAWSLGAEGVWPLLADEARVGAINIKAAAAYYPSNEDEARLQTGTPLLILTGEADDVTEAKGIRHMVAGAASPMVTLHVYPNANHGFDVESIRVPRTVRLLPLVGPAATFGYDPDASRSAAQELAAFLSTHLR